MANENHNKPAPPGAPVQAPTGEWPRPNNNIWNPVRAKVLADALESELPHAGFAVPNEPQGEVGRRFDNVPYVAGQRGAPKRVRGWRDSVLVPRARELLRLPFNVGLLIWEQRDVPSPVFVLRSPGFAPLERCTEAAALPTNPADPAGPREALLHYVIELQIAKYFVPYKDRLTPAEQEACRNARLLLVWQPPIPGPPP